MKFGKQENPVFVRIDQRGQFNELVNSGEWQSLVFGSMKPGAVMGRHYHNHTVIYFYLICGKAKIETLNLKTAKKVSALLDSGQGYIFRPEEVRIINYLESSKFLLMKSHRYDPQNPDLIDYNKDF